MKPPPRWTAWLFAVIVVAALTFVWLSAREFGPDDRPAHDAGHE